jgi:hypothetical protein
MKLFHGDGVVKKLSCRWDLVVFFGVRVVLVVFGGGLAVGLTGVSWKT